MGRNRTSIPFNVNKFRALVKEVSSFSERSAAFGVSKQAINSWMTTGRIPPRALAEMAMDLKWNTGDIAELLQAPITKDERDMSKRLRFSIEIYEHCEEE